MNSNEDIIRYIRKQFFAYRNGIVADTLRKNGDPHHLIMGCQMTDVATIARTISPDKHLAEALWADSKHRECRMIAPMLYPVADMDKTTALRWAGDVECEEIADILCHRLLRKLPFASEIADELFHTESPFANYTRLRLLLNLIMMNKVVKTPQLKARLLSDLQSATSKTRTIITSILEEFNEPK